MDNECNTPPGGGSIDEFFKWLENQQSFAHNLLMNEFPFSAEDAEDAFSDLRAKYLEDPTKCFTLLTLGVLVFWLRRAGVDRLRKARALIRGGGAVHESIDEIEHYSHAANDGCCQSVALRDELRFIEFQLRAIEPQCNAVQNVVRQVMLRALHARDYSFDHLCDLFTNREASAFMRRNGKQVPFTRVQLKRKTNRVRLEVRRLMAKALARSPEGEWLN